MRLKMRKMRNFVVLLSVGLSILAAPPLSAQSYDTNGRASTSDSECSGSCLKYVRETIEKRKRDIARSIARFGHADNYSWEDLIYSQYRINDLAGLIQTANERLNETGEPVDTAFEELITTHDWRGNAKRKLGDCAGAFQDFAVVFRSARDEENMIRVSLGYMQTAFDDINAMSACIDNANIASETAAHQSAIQTYNSGLTKFNARNFTGALSDFNNAISQSPDFAQYYLLRAKTKSALKDYSGWLDDAQKAVSLYKSPNYARFYGELGYAQFANDKLNDAKASLEKAKFAAPGIPEYQDKIAAILSIQEAKANPEAFAFYLSAVKKLRSGDANGAAIDINNAIKKNLYFGDYYNVRANAMYLLMKANQPLPFINYDLETDFKRGAEMNPNNIENRRDLANYYVYISRANGVLGTISLNENELYLLYQRGRSRVEDVLAADETNREMVPLFAELVSRLNRSYAAYLASHPAPVQQPQPQILTRQRTWDDNINAYCQASSYVNGTQREVSALCMGRVK